MIVSVTQGSAAVAAVSGSVVIAMSTAEAEKLRRVCYYNKTVAAKYSNNPVGGHTKSAALDSFLNELGVSLKAEGILRF